MSAFRLTFGIDPGQSGAISVLADGKFERFVDMPTIPRNAGGMHVCGAQLANALREIMARHPGASMIAVLEAVSAMPKQGVTSVFRFGEGYGCIRGVLGALSIPFILVPPQTWKRYLRLTGCDKDAARTLAIQRVPAASAFLHRKKDVGRADALLLALWGEMTEQAPQRDLQAAA